MSEVEGVKAAADVAATDVAVKATTPVRTEPVVAAEPWYTKLKPNEDDIGIYSKYKDEDAALKSIPSRERRISNQVEFPATDAKPENTMKQHRAILNRLGAPKEPAGYKSVVDAARANLPEALKERLGDKFFDKCCEEAHDLGYLPWQFEKHLAMVLAHTEAGMTAESDARIERQDALEKSMKMRYGLKWQGHATNAELVASHLDQYLYENPKALEGDDGLPMKDSFTKLVKDSNDPRLYAVLDHLHELLLSEGDGGGPRRLGGKADDAYTGFYNEAKTRWPVRGEVYWSRYAKQKAGGGR